MCRAEVEPKYYLRMTSPPTRREGLFIGVLVLFLLGHLVARPDLFPFSTYPMFSDNTTSMSWLNVEGPDGPVDPAALGLASDYVINPNAKYGRRVPGPNPGGAPADPADIETRVEAHLDDLDIEWVQVIQTTIEAQPDGSIGRSTTGTWRFDR